jgi:hypothetical protein
LKDPDDITVVCLVKNGELCVRDFIEHHLGLGVGRIVLVDNGSVDRTVDIAREYEGVHVCRLEYSLTGHESQLLARRYVIERLCRSAWCLWLDIDEQFDYPHSSRLSLRRLVKYLGANGYTAVVAQMLDMFSELPLGAALARPEPKMPLRESYRLYDIADIDQLDYQSVPGYPKHHNTVSNTRIRFHAGGIRRRVFGTNQWLTKHPLVFLDGRLRAVTQQHWVTHASCADFSAVLRHYKFLPDFHERNRANYESGFGSQSDYGLLVAGAEAEPVALQHESARPLERVDDLVETGFLIVTDQFLRWVDHSGTPD